MASGKESFADLFEQSAPPKEQRPLRFHVGDAVDAVVVQVTKDSVIVDLDGKRHGFLDVIEVRRPDGTVGVKVGDRLQAKIVAIEPGGDVQLGRTLGRNVDIAGLELAREQGLDVEGKVTKALAAGLEVDVNGVRAFCPASMVDTTFAKDFAEHVGRSYAFRVLEVRDEGRSVIVSRRAVLDDLKRVARDQTLSTLTIGAVMRGTVTNVRDFGAFVDLGGIEGLVPARELSRDRVSPSDVVKPGDVIEVQVKEIQPGEKTRITLSVKSLQTDPWEDVATIAPVGRVLDGTVTRVVDFGAFVRVAAGIEGLLHVSELGRATVVPGQPIVVALKSVDTAAHKLSLVLAPDGAEVGGVARGPELVQGMTVECVVEKVETFGVFVQLVGQKGRSGRGLVPNAELGVPRGSDVRKEFPVGKHLTAKVLQTGDGKLRLSVQALRDDAERAEFEGYREQSRSQHSIGTFADLLKKKLG